MEPITREEYYLAKIAGTWQGKTPEPVTIEEYYLATMAGDYSGNTPQPVTRLQYYMAKAAGVWGGSIPAPVTRLEYYWAAIAGKEGHIPDPVTRQEYLLYAISQSNNDVINTVFGATIIINDAAEGRPFRGLRVFGKSTQDGTPTPEVPAPIVNVGEGGSITMDVTGKNLLPFPYVDGMTKTTNGITFTVNADRSITCTGTAINQAFFNLNKQKYTEIPTDFNKYYSAVDCRYDHSNNITHISVSKSEGYVNKTIYPMVVKKGETNLEYEPPRDPQSLTLQTPNGLPGVPVSKDGNYTDSNGQQWVCDEIDLGRGKYVQRVNNFVLNDKTPFSVDIGAKHENSILINISVTDASNFNTLGANSMLCDRLKACEWNIYSIDEVSCGYTGEVNYLRVRLPISAGTEIEEIKNYLADKSFKILYIIATPIERDLTPEEIAAYKALRTYGPTTVITNDAGAGMEVTYVVER